MGSLIQTAGQSSSGVFGAVGGLIGGAQAASGRQAADDLNAKALQELLNAGLPPDLSKQILIEQYKSAGTLTPEMEKSIDQTSSAVANIKEDPSTRNAQMSALQQFQQLGRTGFGAQDRAALNQVQDETARNAEAKRQQIVQNYQARGQGGSGAEIAAALAGAQSSANQASKQGDDIASQASQRALQALTQGATLGGQVRTQDFNVANTKATAADQMNRFNVQGQRAIQDANTKAANQAQSANLANNQNIANQNTGQNNKELYRQADAKQQYYNSLLNRAGMVSNAYQQRANQFNQQADREAGQWATAGNALGGAFSSTNSGNQGGATTSNGTPWQDGDQGGLGGASADDSLSDAFDFMA